MYVIVNLKKANGGRPVYVLENKCILLGITGGIAAYKSVELVRRLTDLGANVRVMMTENACQFISPLTFQALTKYPVRTSLYDLEAERAMSHIELARWADLIVIAPASANTVAKIANGLCDDLLTTVCVATDKTVILAPAMNHNMWTNYATIDNITVLKKRDVFIIDPGSGYQACGELGPGRMAEVETIVDHIINRNRPKLLINKRVIITAGPTREAIDPVRYLTNHSSGKMGYALASVARDFGASVTLITGPTHLDKPLGITVINVETAEQMYERVMDSIKGCDIFIAAAAVGDYKFKQVNVKKIKKNNQNMTLELISNPDIVAEVAKTNDVGFVVGFAAETNDVLVNAQEKLIKKKLSMVVANHVGGSQGGFNADENEVTLLTQGEQHLIKLANKKIIARKIVEFIAKRI
jgi:phosphopantothenoylcysteine decarboxylase / phosphopantothenate---cysteine ligase